MENQNTDVDYQKMDIDEQKMDIDEQNSKLTIKGKDTTSIQKALDSGVEELDITFQLLTIFPSIGSNSLACLKLSNCYLKNNLDDPNGFPSLSELSLNCVFGDVLNFVSSSCPSVETLEMINCRNVQDIQIPRCLSKIKKLEVTNFSSIDINSPSLEILKLSSSNDVKNIKVKSENLRELELSVTISIEDFRELLSKFPNLEVLVLKDCIGLERLEISHQRLKYFTYYFLNGTLSYRTLRIDTPKLQTFNCAFGDHTIPSSMEVHAQELQNFEFGQTVKPLRDLTLARLRCYLKIFKKCSQLSLTIHGLGQILNQNFLKKVVLPPPYHNLDVLKLNIVDLPQFDFKNLLNGLFWIVRPSALSVGAPDPCKGRSLESLKLKKESFVKALHSLLTTPPGSDCCVKKKVKCWRHYLKKVETPTFETIDYWKDVTFKLVWGEQVSWFEETPTRGLSLQEAENIDPWSPDNLSLAKDLSLKKRLAHIDKRLEAGEKIMPEFWFLLQIARI
ncbi:hypothetical protein ACFE04_002695 [Oxalis oulophora]